MESLQYSQSGNGRLSQEKEREVIQKINHEKKKIFNISANVPWFPHIVNTVTEDFRAPESSWTKHMEYFNFYINSAMKFYYKDSSNGNNGKYGSFIKKINENMIFNILVYNENGNSIIKEMKSIKSLNGTAESLKKSVDEKIRYRNILVCSEQKLVKKIARIYNNPYIEFLDLINEGNLGLINAAEKVDENKKNRFSTYAEYYIKRFIKNSYILNRFKNLPIEPAKLCMKIVYKNRQLYQQKERDATIEELTESMELSEKKIIEFMHLLGPALSLEGNRYDYTNEQRDEYVKNQKTYSPETVLINKTLREKLIEELDRLDPVASDMIKMHNRFSYDRKYTFEEIAKKYGYKSGKKRSHQIVTRTLKKMRKSGKVRDKLYHFLNR